MAKSIRFHQQTIGILNNDPPQLFLFTSLPIYNMQDQPYCTIFLFINSASGGGIGSNILSQEVQKVQFSIIPQRNSPSRMIHVYFFDLLNKKNKAFMKVKEVTDQGRRTIGIVCGEDGTIMWVVSEMYHFSIDPNKISIGILPLGTGNDFSQYLGWGKQTKTIIVQNKYKQLKKLIKRWLLAKEEYFDIWDVIAEVQEKGKFQKVNKSSNNQIVQGKVLRKSFCNYFSFGIDGKVGYSFDKYRTNSRFGNLMVYGAMGVIKSATKTKSIKDLVQKMEIKHQQGNENINISTSVIDSKSIKQQSPQKHKGSIIFSSQPKKQEPSLQSDYHNMLFLNIDGYMGGVKDIWSKASTKGDKKWHEQMSSDGQIQIISFSSSVGLALEKIFGGFGKKVEQGKGPYFLTFKESTQEKHRTYLQIDGEFIRITHPKSLTIKKSHLSQTGKIKVLRRNKQSEQQL